MQAAPATLLEAPIVPPRIVSRSARAAATRALRNRQSLRGLIDQRVVRAEMARMRAASSPPRRTPGSR